MEKVDIFLEPEERAALEKMAKDAGLGISDVVRDLLRVRIRQNQGARMRESAKRMVDSYQTDKELTAFSDLDGEATSEYPDKR